MCPGHHLAKIELSKVLATIVRDYEIELVDENQEWKCKGHFTVITEPWPVYIKRRNVSI